MALSTKIGSKYKAISHGSTSMDRYFSRHQYCALGITTLSGKSRGHPRSFHRIELLSTEKDVEKDECI